jgi:hypothetical protein
VVFVFMILNDFFYFIIIFLIFLIMLNFMNNGYLPEV